MLVKRSDIHTDIPQTLPVRCHSSEKSLVLLQVSRRGGGSMPIGAIFSGVGDTPVVLTMCPRYLTSFWSTSHCASFSFKPAQCRFRKTSRSWMQVKKSGEMTIILQYYNITRVNYSSACSAVHAQSNRWKLVGANIRQNWNNFHFHSLDLVAKADFSWASRSRGTRP